MDSSKLFTCENLFLPAKTMFLKIIASNSDLIGVTFRNIKNNDVKTIFHRVSPSTFYRSIVFYSPKFAFLS